MASPLLDSVFWVATPASSLPPVRSAPSNGVILTTNTTSDVLDGLSLSITTMAELPQRFPTISSPGPSDPLEPAIASKTSSAAGPVPAAPTANEPVTTPPSSLPNAASSTLATLTSSAAHPTATPDPPPAWPTFDPFSNPSGAYLPGTPPVLVALYCIVVAWTLLFAYILYHLHRYDAAPRPVPAHHPQWQQEENHQGQRSPKKPGARFEMRGMRGKRVEREKESLGVFDGSGGREMVMLDTMGSGTKADKRAERVGEGEGEGEGEDRSRERKGGMVSRVSQREAIGGGRRLSREGR